MQRQVNYVESIILTRDTANLGVSIRGVIQIISDIVQACSHVQSDNHVDCLIQEKRLPNLKRRGQVIKDQAMITE